MRQKELNELKRKNQDQELLIQKLKGENILKKPPKEILQRNNPRKQSFFQLRGNKLLDNSSANTIQKFHEQIEVPFIIIEKYNIMFSLCILIHIK